MKKLWVGLGVFVLLLCVGAFIYRDQIGMMIAFAQMKPEQSFTGLAPPRAPDYSDPVNWAALPDRKDLADAVPSGEVVDAQAAAEVDVFFIHPTTYYQNASWNQPVEDANTNQFTDAFVMRGQASVFNSCCRVYAPRYRQATLYSFMDDTGSGAAALDLAYGDVERAFDYFVEHYSAGRPFVLAAHSQGSLHLQKLLTRRITGTPLRERLVAAYPIGFAIDRNELAKAAADVPVCASAEQTGCLVTWNAIGLEASRFGDAENPICVNPLTWRDDAVAARHALNLGGVAYPSSFRGSMTDVKGVPQEYLDAEPVLEMGVADAQCVDGMLVVTEIRSDLYTSRPLGRDNYHIYDYSLFHMNLRLNAETRAKRYLASPSGLSRTRPTEVEPTG